MNRKWLHELPYLLIALYATKIGQAWRLAEGMDAAHKLLSLMDSLSASFASPLPSFELHDLCIGLLLGAVSLLWYFVRCIIATPQGVLAVGMTGEEQLLRWDQITRLKLENGRLLLLDVAGRQCAVGGSRRAQLAFVRLAQERLRPGVGAAVLQALEQKLSR